MRDIEFRGKRTEDGEWIYGYLADMNEINNVNVIAMPCEEVDEDSVGQWTGLYDVNNKKIYEGDIIRTTDKHKTIGYIGWLRQAMGFCIVWNKFDSRLGHRARGGGYDWDNSIEVIGNMTDDFELIPWLNKKEKN